MSGAQPVDLSGEEPVKFVRSPAAGGDESMMDAGGEGLGEAGDALLKLMRHQDPHTSYGANGPPCSPVTGALPAHHAAMTRLGQPTGHGVVSEGTKKHQENHTGSVEPRCRDLSIALGWKDKATGKYDVRTGRSCFEFLVLGKTELVVKALKRADANRASGPEDAKLLDLQHGELAIIFRQRVRAIPSSRPPCYAAPPPAFPCLPPGRPPVLTRFSCGGPTLPCPPPRSTSTTARRR